MNQMFQNLLSAQGTARPASPAPATRKWNQNNTTRLNNTSQDIHVSPNRMSLPGNITSLLPGPAAFKEVQKPKTSQRPMVQLHQQTSPTMNPLNPPVGNRRSASNDFSVQNAISSLNTGVVSPRFDFDAPPSHHRSFDFGWKGSPTPPDTLSRNSVHYAVPNTTFDDRGDRGGRYGERENEEGLTNEEKSMDGEHNSSLTKLKKQFQKAIVEKVKLERAIDIMNQEKTTMVKGYTEKIQSLQHLLSQQQQNQQQHGYREPQSQQQVLEERARWQGMVNEYEGRLREAERESSEARDRVETLQGIYEEKLREVEIQNSDLQAKYAEMMEVLKSCENELEETKVTYAKLSKDNKKFKSADAQLKAQIEVLQQANAELENVVSRYATAEKEKEAFWKSSHGKEIEMTKQTTRKEYEALVEDLKREFEKNMQEDRVRFEKEEVEHRKNIQSLELSNNQLKCRLQILSEQIDQVNKQKDSKETELSCLREELAKFKEEVALLNSREENHQVQIEKWEDELRSKLEVIESQQSSKLLLQSELSAKNDACEKMHQELSQIQEENCSLKSQIEMLSTEAEDVRQELQNSLNQISELSRNKDSTYSDLEKLQEELKGKNNELIHQSQAKALQEEKISEISQEAAKLKADVAQANLQVSELQSLLEQRDKLLKTVNDELLSLKEEKVLFESSSDMQITNANQTIQKLMSELSQEAAKYRSLQESCYENDIQIDTLTKQKNEAENSLSGLKEKLSKLEEEASSLRIAEKAHLARISTQDKTLKQKEEENDNLTKINARLQKELSTVQTEGKQSQETLDLRVQEQLEEIKRLEGQLQLKQNEFDELQKTNETAHETLSVLEKTLAASKLENDSISIGLMKTLENVATLERQVLSKEQTVAELGAALEDKIKEMESIRQDLQNAQEEHATAAAAALEKVQNLETTISGHESSNNELKQNLEDKDKEIEALNTNLKCTQEETAAVQKTTLEKIEKLEREILRKEEAIAELSQNFEDKEKGIGDLYKRLQNAQEENTVLQKSSMEKVGALEAEVSKKEEIHCQLRSKLDEKEKEIEDLNKDLRSQREEFCALQASTSNKIERLEKGISCQEDCNVKLSHCLEDKEKEIETTKTSLKCVQEELETLSKTTKDNIEKLESEISRKAEEIAELSQTLTQKEKEIEDLQGQLQGAKEETSKLQTETSEKIAALEKEKIASEETNDQLRQDLADKNLELQDLREALKSAQEEITTLQAIQEAKGKEIEGLNESIVKYQEDVSQLRLENSQVSAEVLSLEEKTTGLKHEIDDLQAQIEGKNQKILECEQESKSLETELSEMKSQFEGKNQELESSLEKSKVLKTQVDHLSTANKLNLERISKMEKEIADKSNEILVLQATMEESHGNLIGTNNKIKEQLDFLTDQKSKLDEMIVSLREEVSHKTEQIESLRKSQIELEAKESALLLEKVNLIFDNETMKDNLETMKNKYESLVGQTAESEAEWKKNHEATQEILQQKTEAITTLEGQVEELKKENRGLIESMEEVSRISREALENNENAISGLKSQIVTLEDEKKALGAEFETFKQSQVKEMKTQETSMEYGEFCSHQETSMEIQVLDQCVGTHEDCFTLDQGVGVDSSEFAVSKEIQMSQSEFMIDHGTDTQAKDWQEEKGTIMDLEYFTVHQGTEMDREGMYQEQEIQTNHIDFCEEKGTETTPFDNLRDESTSVCFGEFTTDIATETEKDTQDIGTDAIPEPVTVDCGLDAPEACLMENKETYILSSDFVNTADAEIQAQEICEDQETSMNLEEFRMEKSTSIDQEQFRQETTATGTQFEMVTAEKETSVLQGDFEPEEEVLELIEEKKLMETHLSDAKSQIAKCNATIQLKQGEIICLKEQLENFKSQPLEEILLESSPALAPKKSEQPSSLQKHLLNGILLLLSICFPSSSWISTLLTTIFALRVCVFMLDSEGGNWKARIISPKNDDLVYLGTQTLVATTLGLRNYANLYNCLAQALELFDLGRQKIERLQFLKHPAVGFAIKLSILSVFMMSVMSEIVLWRVPIAILVEIFIREAVLSHELFQSLIPKNVLTTILPTILCLVLM